MTKKKKKEIPNEKLKEFVAYYRVSSASQMKDDKTGLSIEDQRAVVTARVEEEGGRIVKEFIEVHSAWVKSRLRGRIRVQARKAIEMCQENGYIFIFPQIDRAARDVEFAYSIKNSGIEFMAANMKSVDNMTFTIYAAMAQEFSDNLSRKIKGVKAIQKMKGQKIGWWDQKTHPNMVLQGLQSAKTRIFKYFLEESTEKLHFLLQHYTERYKNVKITHCDKVVYPKRKFLEKKEIESILFHINTFERELFGLKKGQKIEQPELRKRIDVLRRNAKGFRNFFGENTSIMEAEEMFTKDHLAENYKKYMEDAEKQANSKVAAVKRSEKKKKLMEEYMEKRNSQVNNSNNPEQ